MYITNFNKNNEGSLASSQSSSMQPSRSNSRPPVINRFNSKQQDSTSTTDDLPLNRYSLPRPKRSSYVQQSRQMYSDIIKSSLDRSGALAKEDKEFFNMGIGNNTKGGHIMPKRLQTQRSRMLRPLAGQYNKDPSLKGSAERNWTYFGINKENNGSAQVEPIDMEQFFQVEPSLHQRKRYNQTTPKIGMKAILPDIFQKQQLEQTNFITSATDQTPDLKSSIIEHSQEIAATGNFNQLTPGDNQNLNDSNISQTVVKNSSTTKNQNMKHRTERMEGGGSRTREKSQQKIPQIKVRPLSSTKRVFNLGESQSTVEKTRMGLNIARSSSTLLQMDAQASVSTSAQTNATIIPQSETSSDLLNSRPPKDKKKTTRAPSKGLCGLPLTNIKNKRMSVNAPVLTQQRDDSINNRTSKQPLEINHNCQQMIKCGIQDRRFLDLLLWQTLPSHPGSLLEILTSLWNYLSNQHFALRPLDIDTTKSLLKSDVSSDLLQHFSMMCCKKWVKSVVKDLSITDMIEGLRYGSGSKCYVAERGIIIVGYEVRGIDDGRTEVSINECEIYLITVPQKQDSFQAFETIRWEKKMQINEVSISLESK